MQFNNKLKRNNKGFTLLELLVTVVILALITAPFLSSFVSASKTNAKSKRIQEANELSQHIIEQFKGSSVERVVNDYDLTPSNEVINGNKNSVFYKNDESKNDGNSPGFPSGFSSGYSAKIELKPTKSVVNEDNVIPVIEGLDRENCVVIADNITRHDASVSGADHRYVRVEVSKDSTEYKVKLQVKYQTAADTDVGGSSFKDIGEWKYNDMPTIYLLYVPLNTAVYGSDIKCKDRVEIINNVYEDKTDISGNVYTSVLNTYIVQQKTADGFTAYSYPRLMWDRVSVKEYSSGAVKIQDLLDVSNTTDVLHNTVVHTNVYGDSMTGILSDKDGTIYDTVKTIKIDTIYNLDVTINYNGNAVASYNASKTVSGD